jgi:hypothetical protein
MQKSLPSHSTRDLKQGTDGSVGERHSNLERGGMFRDFNQFYAKHYRWRMVFNVGLIPQARQVSSVVPTLSVFIPNADKKQSGVLFASRRCAKHTEDDYKNYAVGARFKLLLLILSTCTQDTTLRPGTHYPHVTWAHVMLRVQLGCERRFDIEFYGADSHFCHSAYVTWSHVELTCQHASHISVVAHISWDVTSRDLMVFVLPSCKGYCF